MLHLRSTFLRRQLTAQKVVETCTSLGWLLPIPTGSKNALPLFVVDTHSAERGIDKNRHRLRLLTVLKPQYVCALYVPLIIAASVIEVFIYDNIF